MVKRGARIGIAVLSLAVAAGCGESVTRTQLAGSVTYDGQPVLAGRVYFNPDVAKKNDGPQGYADIKDGRYDTRTSGKGAMAGALIVRVEGFDGQPEDGRPIGHPLFVYETTVDLAQGSDAAKNFAITSAEAKRLEKSKAKLN